MSRVLPLRNILEDFKQECFAGKDASRIMQLYNYCVNKTKEFCNANRISDVEIGISGGIDSALIASIAVDALGKNHVYALVLPGPYTSQESLADANQLIENLGIESLTIYINSAYESIVNSMQLVDFAKKDGQIKDLTLQNIQARCRMIFLMAAANEHGRMLLNTANKSEVYTGYSTLYGDMAGGFAPIANIYKTDVFKMCVFKNLQQQRMYDNDFEIIPNNIINKAPSAELTQNQTDESSLGIDYPTLDAILHELVDNKKQIKDIVFLGYSEQEVQKVANLVKRSEFKRRYEPPCA